jgi:uncharacterized protein (UPF0212 family)
MEFKFNYEDSKYILDSNKCDCLVNDDEKPITGLSIEKIFELLNDSEVDFDVEYYQEACPKCLKGVKEKEKFFEFLEFHFYVFSKDSKFVISDISKEYQGLSFNKLLKDKKVDDSYIVSIIICKNCLDYIIQIENCSI